MTKLSWFRKLILVTLCVALTTTLPLPMLDLLFRSQVAYAAPQSRQSQPGAFPIAGESGNPFSEAMETMETMETADMLPPELSSSLGMFDPNGEPEGMLMDVGAIEAALNRAPTEPDSLANPISISRAQSAYQPGDAINNTLLITFTVTNNRPPAVVPQVPESATITDSMAIMAEFDYSNDPNTMRNVMVVDELTANATYIASSPLPDQNGTTNAWNLGDIAPLSSSSFTLTLQIPASVSDFTNLDTGATAWGTLQGRQVSAQSSPATLTPEVINGEAIGDWLKWTVDADIYDEYMLQKAAEIGQAPDTLFAYVRSLGYESYSGSLRGTRGTIWSEAGNSLDQASLLIAMLRTSGIPARYRHGTLEPARAQELILSMFPEPTRVIGHIPDGMEVADPANDPQLLAETEDHWWVEAYVPSQGGWTDLDPSFSNAAIGSRFVTDANIANDGSDKIAEVPDNVRHKVTLKLKVEDYHPLNIGGDIPRLEHTYPLTHTFNTVELVGDPVTLGHLVNSSGQGGLVFSVIRHTYVPYFLVGDELIEGDPYQDLLTNFPLGTTVHTAVWLIFETQDAAGNVETYEREIVDRIGFEARQGGGNAGIQLPEGNPPLISQLDLYNVNLVSSKIPTGVFNQTLVETPNLVASAANTDLDAPSSDDWQLYLQSSILLIQSINMAFHHSSDIGSKEYSESVLVKNYHDVPKITIVSNNINLEEDKLTTSFDLLRNDRRVISYPGQNTALQYTFNMISGMMDTALEKTVLQQFIRGTDDNFSQHVNVPDVFESAESQGIELVTILDEEALGNLDISQEAKARIHDAINNGKIVIVPSQMVQIDDIFTTAWWEIDSESGKTIGVGENGLHISFISTALTTLKSLFLALAVPTVLAIVLPLLGFLVLGLLNMEQGINEPFKQAANFVIDAVSNVTLAIGSAGFCYLITRIPKLPFEIYISGFCAGLAIGLVIVAQILAPVAKDPPLPDYLLKNPLSNQASSSTAQISVPQAQSHFGTTLNISLEASSTAISSTIGATTFYAPALSGMGVGGNGTAYGAANYANSAAFQAQGANLMIGGPAGGTLQVGSESVSVPNGVAIAGYSANVSIAEASATTDQVELASSQADFFTLDLSTDTSTTNPVSAVNFQANISANFDETYTMTVEAPDGWHVEVDGTGVIAATPPLGAAEGAYTILVVAQSGTYPDLFVSTLHTATVTSYEGMEMSVSPDPLITIPWGPTDANAIPGGTNNGQMQITGAAFTLDITNTSTIAHEFTLSVSGLPDGWLVLSGEEGQSETSTTLPAGGIGQVGLYISPTVSTLPPVGTVYPFTVEAVASDNATLSATDDESFTVPGIAFSQLEASPVEIYSSPGLSTTFLVSVRNVGNMTGSFPLSVTRPISTTWSAQYNTPLSLDAGEAITQTVTLLTPDGEIGEDYVVSVESPSGAYTQIASVVVRLLGPNGQCAYQAAAAASELDNVPLASAVESLAQQMAALEVDPADLAQRDQVVAALQEVIGQLGDYLTLPTTLSLQEIAQTMPTHSSAAEMNADLAALCDALTGLNILVTAQQEHGVSVRFTPGLNAALPGQTVPYTLTISNQGTEPTSYAATLTSTLLTPSSYTTPLLAPGTLYTVPLTVTPTALGFYTIDSSVMAIGEEELLQYIQADTTAGLNVVESFVEVLQVTADPSFVETGVSSSTLSVDVANIADIYLPANVRTEIQAEDGSTQWSDQMPVGLRTGASRRYTLSEVNTSGWASGAYTITVELLDDSNTLIPDGRGHGYLLVGQGLQASHAVHPAIVAPGTVTVTTAITTSLHEALQPTQAQLLPQAEAESQRVDVRPSAAQISFAREESQESESTEAKEPASVGFVYQEPFEIWRSEGQPFMPSPVFSQTGIIRHEEDDALITYNGDWSTFSAPRASNGQAFYSNSADDTATFTFTGTWVGVGFATNINSGQVELFIDGVSQGIIDTYSRDDDVASYYYDGLSAGSHTISLTVLGTSNLNANNAFVVLDYIDVWDGTDMPSGTFEHDSDRVRLSNNWRVSNNDVASDGSYIYSGSNAWFAFTGDSISFQAIVGTGGNEIELLIDGKKVDRFDLYHSSIITRTFSFDGLGAGPHVLQVSAYRGTATVDAFTTPGSAPFYEPLVRTGMVRYEEDHPALRYNGVPFEQTARSWNIADYNWGSYGYATWSETVSDTVSLTFTGSWVGLGFITRSSGGLAEVFIDGVSQGVVDSYSNSDDVLSLYYDGLTSGNHTISVEVLGTSHPNSSNEYVRLDYIDVWDGTDMPDGTFEHDSDRVRLSNNWRVSNNDVASDGSYIYSGSNVWFPFTGDSISFQAIAGTGGNEIEILIDGQIVDRFDLYHSSTITRTFSFDGLAAGPHMLQVNAYRGTATVDAFTTPGSAPFYESPVRTGVVRYEEDDSALRYNGVSFQQTARSWNIADYNWASNGYGTWSETVSDTVSLTFTGSWAGLGFITRSSGGLAEVFIDGVSQGVVDTYSSSNDVLSLYYDGLTSGTHTISVEVLGTRNDLSSNEYIRIDYIDVWDGTPMSQGLFNENHARVSRSSNWRETSDTRVNGDAYIQDGSNVWFTFTGNEVTYVGVTDRNTATRAEVFIDGVSKGVVDLNYDFSRSPVPFHYTNLGAGAHVMRIKNIARAGVDAFDTSNTPFAGLPMVEWYDTAPDGGGSGMESTAAAGDINGDGIVEIAATSYDGNLYVYRGDGADAGNGSPLLWSAEIGIGDSPAMVELDGQPGAEIVVTSNQGLYAFHHDGTQYWFNDTVKSYWDASFGIETWSGPAVANLDNEPSPEIVIGGYDCLCVVEADGTVAWRYPFPANGIPSPPVLSDLTGDGKLDILVAQNDTLYLFDYNSPDPTQPVWTRVITSGLSSFGSPAVANVDGLLPGGDSGPEIVMGWGPQNPTQGVDAVVELLDTDDGSVIWSSAVGGGRPTSISIADTDGDREVEMVLATRLNSSEHKIHLLNADGSLLWDRIVRDRTAATSGTSLHDLDGDGIWEVVANTEGDGLIIFRGDDGTIIFNEPRVNSHTLVDYPIVVDVDDDGHAEIVAGDPDGIYVIGHDGVWAPSRPLWNQYNYHVTNIKNDLTVPEVEPDSWTVHNTYRTQTPVEDPFAGYQVDLTHTIAESGMEVLTDTFSAPPDTLAPRGAYHWSYEQVTPSRTTSFDAVLPDMQPGEVRQISEGTIIAYQFASGFNQLTLPPLYVEAAHIIAIEPVSQTITTGSRAIYDVTLSNPGTTPATYNLAVNGLAEGWANLPTTINLDPESEITLPMTITVPTAGELGEYDFTVTVNNGLGGTDQASATLIVADLLDITVSPDLLFASAGEVVTYTVTITNSESVARNYALTHIGLDGNQVTLPDTLEIAANSSMSVPLIVQAYANRGIHLFTVNASTVETGVSSQDDAVLEILNDWQVTATLTPPVAKGGPGTTVAYTLTVTNTGSISDTYDLSVSVPDGWSYRLQANGTDLDTLSLTPYVFNRANLTLLVTPATTATPGNYDIRASVQSQNHPDARAVANAVLEVTPYGVQVAISPASVSLEPTDTGTWDVTVTNTGSEADTYDLIATGIVAGSARFEPETVSLAAGEAQTVQLSADILEFALRQSYQFSAIARSTTQEHIQNEDSATITFEGYEALEVEWRPTTQVLTDSLSTAYMLVITNTGNVDTTYQLSLNAPGLTTQLETGEVYIPPHMTAGILATVEAPGSGTYTIEAMITSTTSDATGSDTATLIIGNDAPTVTPTPTSVPVTQTPTPVTSTPTATPVTVTPTPITATPVTATSTPTGTPVTATPVSVTPTATDTPVSVTPTPIATPGDGESHILWLPIIIDEEFILPRQ